MKYGDQRAIASKFGKLSPELFVSWIRAINGVRNACAHHSRVWNTPLIDVPRLPRNNVDSPDLLHIISDRPAQTRLYAAAYALQFLMKGINPSSTWAARIKNHLSSFPTSSIINLQQAGFPSNWDQLRLWN